MERVVTFVVWGHLGSTRPAEAPAPERTRSCTRGTTGRGPDAPRHESARINAKFVRSLGYDPGTTGLPT